MKQFDLTEQIKNGNKYNNFHVFNNSIVHYKDNIYIMVYRCIRYNISHDTHPWDMWGCNCNPDHCDYWYEGYTTNTEECTTNTEECTTNTEECESDNSQNHIYSSSSISSNHSNDYSKYGYSSFSGMSPYIYTSTGIYDDYLTDYFKNNKTYKIYNLGKYVNKINENDYETDTTGLCVLIFDGKKFNMMYNINNIFEYDNYTKHHDSRIYNINGKIYLTYNTYQYDDTRFVVQMSTCEIDINLDNKYIRVHNEKLLINNYKDVEKNCIIHGNDVLYSLHKNFVFEHGKNLITKSSDILNKIYKKYDNIYVSLSTPVVDFDDYYLSVGHIKLNHESNDVKKFFKDNNIDIRKFKIIHTYWMYFSFFFLFDKSYNIVKISDFFIFENAHANFPSGLTKTHDGNYFLSYGVNDNKSIVLMLTKNEINSLLKTDTPEFKIFDTRSHDESDCESHDESDNKQIKLVELDKSRPKIINSIQNNSKFINLKYKPPIMKSSNNKVISLQMLNPHNHHSNYNNNNVVAINRKAHKKMAINFL